MLLKHGVIMKEFKRYRVLINSYQEGKAIEFGWNWMAFIFGTPYSIYKRNWESVVNFCIIYISSSLGILLAGLKPDTISLLIQYILISNLSTGFRFSSDMLETLLNTGWSASENVWEASCEGSAITKCSVYWNAVHRLNNDPFITFMAGIRLPEDKQ